MHHQNRDVCLLLKLKFAPSDFAHETEITITGTLHDGLRSLQNTIGTESLHHSEIPVAMKQITEIEEAKVFVELRVLAAYNIEIKSLRRFTDRLNVKTATARPNTGDLFHRCQICPKLLCPSLTILSSKLHDNLSGDFVRPILPNSTLKRLNHGNQYPCLDLASFKICNSRCSHVNIHIADSLYAEKRRGIKSSDIHISCNGTCIYKTHHFNLMI
jgi:hypothetical protein